MVVPPFNIRGDEGWLSRGLFVSGVGCLGGWLSQGWLSRGLVVSGVGCLGGWWSQGLVVSGVIIL